MKDEWFKSLYGLSKCRTIEDVKKSDEIVDVYKEQLINDIFWYYIVPAERLGRDDFIISSGYPASCTLPSRNVKFADYFLTTPMLCFYPISPSRMIFLTHKYAALFEPENNYPIRKGFLKGWGMYNKRMKLPIWKMCGIDVRFVNDGIKKCGIHGYVSAL